MNPYQKRMKEIAGKAALRAWNQPLLNSGLWFHGDVRDNFYYASYLFATAVDGKEEPPFDRDEGRRLAEAVLLRVLRLQDTNPDSPLYGHWPLGLDPVPEQAPPHALPVEMMGSLMVFFHQTYGGQMSKELAEHFDTGLRHVFRSGFYRKPLVHYGHHEAKYTAAKLIFGRRYDDAALFADGRRCLKQTLEKIRREGMAEYGGLPWFWHWIQAFTCAWMLFEDPEVKAELAEMLDHLWEVRALYYLKGAWAGPHSRGWPHDVPKDANVLHDYVQFGDFGLPEEMPRTEYAGFLFYEAPESARRRALDHAKPAEICRAVIKEVDGGKRKLHSYVYVTNRFASGGLWERVKEFDNEQIRWLFSLPIRGGGKGNQLYFFHPGEGYDPSGIDPRHQSEWTAVLYHKNAVMALYPLPEDVPDQVIGVLPEGDWTFAANAIFGRAEAVFFGVYLTGSYEIRRQDGYNLVVCGGRRVGVVIEAMDLEDAERLGISGLEAFASAMSAGAPRFTTEGELGIEYTVFLNGDRLSLRVSGPGDPGEPMLNGKRLMWNYDSF